MFNLKKTIFGFIIIFTLLLTSCGTPKISESDVRSGSGKYIDCSSFEKTQYDDGWCMQRLAKGVEFDNKEDFFSFFKSSDYTNEQKTLMADLSMDDKLELPQTDSMLSVKFGNTENINEIEWFGEDCYIYNLSAEFADDTFTFNFQPALSVEEVEDFFEKRDNDENRKKSVYWQDGVKYIKYTGTALNGADFTVYHWSVENEDNKFYVYQSMHGDIGSFWGTDYNFVEILVENSYGYQFITLENSAEISLTPELVKQFTVYSQNIE